MAADRSRIVVGVDGSDQARQALVWALDWAASRNADVDIVHAWRVFIPANPTMVVPYHVDVAAVEASARQMIHSEVEIVRGAGRQLNGTIEEIVVEGPAAGALMDTAQGAELLVVGSRGRGGFASLLLGSVSHQCLRHGTSTLAIIRNSRVRRDGPIVVGSDLSDGANDALRWALVEAANTGAPVEVVVSSDDGSSPFDSPHDSRDARLLVERTIADVRTDVPEADDVTVAATLVDVDPGDALVEASTRALMLVVGTRGRGGFRSLVLGSVSEHCAHNARCPVIVVRPQTH